jgi:hypothetical protein
MGSLYLHYLAVVCSKMCTDTPLVPARLPPPICLVVPARHPPRACLRCRTGPPSAWPYCHAILSSARLVVHVDNIRAILHDGRGRNFSPVVQYGGYSVYMAIDFAPTVPSVLLYDAWRVVSEKLLNPPNLGSPFY